MPNNDAELNEILGNIDNDINKKSGVSRIIPDKPPQQVSYLNDLESLSNSSPSIQDTMIDYSNSTIGSIVKNLEIINNMQPPSENMFDYARPQLEYIRQLLEVNQQILAVNQQILQVLSTRQFCNYTGGYGG